MTVRRRSRCISQCVAGAAVDLGIQKSDVRDQKSGMAFGGLAASENVFDVELSFVEFALAGMRFGLWQGFEEQMKSIW